MTKQETKQRARVQALAEKWMKPLGLGWWGVHIRYSKVPLTTDGTPDPLYVFVVDVQWEYLDAHITAYLPAVQNQSDEDLEYCFVHELAHIFIAELAKATCEDKQKHAERVATTLAWAFIWLRQHVEDTLPSSLAQGEIST